jgi:hypothetical protein
VPDQVIRVTARQRIDGIDIGRLALALLQFAGQLPESQKSIKAKQDTGRSASSKGTVTNKRKGAA